MTLEQQSKVVRNWVRENFVKPNAIADKHSGDILAAVQALDAYFDVNAVAMNNTLPEPFKSQATVSQKASLAAEIMLTRWNG